MHNFQDQGAAVRAAAARLLWQVLDQGQALSGPLNQAQQQFGDSRDRALLQQLTMGVLRDFPRFDALARLLLEKPLAGSARPLHFLLLVGLWQLRDSRIPPHAAVAATVAAAALLRAPGLKAMVNAILRRYQRQRLASNLGMMSAMEAFKRLFGSRSLAVNWLRNTGMRRLNSISTIKKIIINTALGVS